MQFTTLALDVDGTLINNAKVITSFTRNEIGRVVQDEQLGLVLASSRMPHSLRNVMIELGQKGHIVAYNGALTQVLRDDAYETIVSTPLPREILRMVVDHPGVADLHVGLFFGDEWIVSAMDYWALREARTSQTWPDVIGLPGDLGERAGGLHKLMMRGEARAIDEVVAMLSGFEHEVAIYRPKGNLVEMTAASVSKAAAIAQVLVHTGQQMENLLAFGDNLNDTEMLASAGWGVAMANAPDAVKRVADEVTLTNDEDGVGYMLRKHFPCSREDFRP